MASDTMATRICAMLLCLGSGLCLPGCGKSVDSGTDTGNPNDGGWIVDSPLGELAGSHGSHGANPDNDNAPTGGREHDDAMRAITEADLIQTRGDLLYALAPATGLHIVDMASPSTLSLLSSTRLYGSAFELYLDGDMALVLINDLSAHVWDDMVGGHVYQQVARVSALDVSDPTAVLRRGSFDVPGRITDSRRVGEILYVISVEDGHCWGCASAPNTTLTSLDLSDLSDIRVIDQLTFDGDEAFANSHYRPISVTSERIYVGSDTWSPTGDTHSFIQVVDISDPEGALQPGAALPVAGAIQNRWQMDEHEGILRVISQGQGGDPSVAPVVETFEVHSADDIVPLGRLPLVLPRPETLRAVRFDGTRGYAITAERTDPLFIVDLSDPAAPLQRGELELPGFVHHLEPRGDRLIGLGFDNQNPMGELHASLFDVSDADAPGLIERVHFGGDSGNFGDDQDRLHKALGVHEDLGLLTVPFTSYYRMEAEIAECAGASRSGIQLIDFSRDDLSLRGVAEQVGRARRSLLHGGSLIAISEEAVGSHDISDRDAPRGLSQVRIGRNVSGIALGDDIAVRLSTDTETRRRDVLDVVTRDGIAGAEASGELVLEPFLPADPKALQGGFSPVCFFDWADDGLMFVRDGHAFLVSSLGGVVLSVFDVRDPQDPRFVSSTIFEDVDPGHPDHVVNLFPAPRRRMVLSGGILVGISLERNFGPNDELLSSIPMISLIDVRDPGAPRLLPPIELPDSLSHGGLMVAGDQVVFGRLEAVAGQPDKIRVLLERLDLGDPDVPAMLPAVSLPGVPLHLDRARGRVVTLEPEVGERLDEDSCNDTPLALRRYDGDAWDCFEMRLSAGVVALSDGVARRVARAPLPGWPRRVALSDTRLFVSSTTGEAYGVYAPDDGWDGPQQLREVELRAYDLDGDDLQASDPIVLYGDVSSLHASGDRAIVVQDDSALVVDAGDLGGPQTRSQPLTGYCYVPVADDQAAYCVGHAGVQPIPFAE